MRITNPLSNVPKNIYNAWQGLIGQTTAEAILPLPPNADPDEHLWQSFGFRLGLSRRRNLPGISQDQALNQVHYFYKGNPLAKRMIDITAEYCIGDGITYTAQNRKVREVLDAHWTDTTNNWAIGQFERIRDLGLAGELCFPVFINKENGHVVLGNIDTELIERIIEDPDNSVKNYAIVLKKLPRETFRRVYKIIDIANVSQDSDAFGRLVGIPETEDEKEKFGCQFMLGEEVEFSFLHDRRKARWAGSCFYFSVNKPLTASRGWSDLLQNLDWIDAHDQYLFAQVEKAIESAKYIWDILARGMNEKQMNDWLRKQPPFNPGTRFVHNENIEQNVKSPDLKLEDASALANVLKNHLLAGVGMPPIWFAEGGVSRASAPEMTEPSFKHIRLRQRYAAFMISTILRFALDQATLKGRLRLDRRLSKPNQEGSASFYLKMPDVSAKDQRALSIAVRNISGALKEGLEMGYVTKDEAKRLFRRYLDLLGLDSWKNEPSSETPVGKEPDEDFSPEKLFRRATESGEREVVAGGAAYYLYLDPLYTEEGGRSDTNNLLTEELVMS